MRASRAKVAALQETATTAATAEAASSRACASAPWRGGSNTTASKRLSSAGANGRRNRSRASASIGLEPRRRLGGASQGSDRVLVAVRRDDARAFGEPQRERPDAGRTGRRSSSPADMLRHKLRQHGFALGRSLQECARRQRDVARGPSARSAAARCATISPWRVSRASRWCSATRASAVSARGGKRAGAAHVDVEAGIGRRHLDVERLALGAERFGDRPGGARARHRAMARAPGSGRSARCGAPAAPQSRPRARRACRAAHGRPRAGGPRHARRSVVDRRVDARLRQRIDHERALPLAIARLVPMLQRAAATHAEMRADRRDALGARAFDIQQAAAVGMARPVLRPSRFRPAAYRAHAPARPAFPRCRRRAGRAARSSAAQPRCAPTKNSRLPSLPAIGEGKTPRFFQPSVARNAAISSQTAACTAGSRTMPFFKC